MSSVIHERAYAKVNLWLEILGRRQDGFHQLETVMHEIDLADDVQLELADDFQFHVDDATVGTGEDNLAVKALRALERAMGRKFCCHITLGKRIPAGAGLGGGSSDAAAVLRGLNRLFKLDLSVLQMEEIAGEFGSDTSFFVRGQTAMCRGRGELIEPIELNRSFFLVLVFPGIHVATGPIFQALHLTDTPQSPYDFLNGLSTNDVPVVRSSLFNRLEEAAMRVHTDLAAILGPLKSRGFIMSGSGSTMFSLTSNRRAAEKLAAAIARDLDLKTQVVLSAVR